MLTDTALRNFKPKAKIYKAFDRDGMYVTVSPVGTVTFRYDYRLNGRRETLTIVWEDGPNAHYDSDEYKKRLEAAALLFEADLVDPFEVQIPAPEG